MTAFRDGSRMTDPPTSLVPRPATNTSGTDASGWRLEILEGPNAGAQVPLAPGPYRLGLAAANDIVLSDPGIAPEHLSLTISAHGAAVIAHAPGVDLHRRALGTGVQQALRGSSDIRLGSTLLRLHGPAAPATALPGRTAMASLGLAGLAVACLTFAAGSPGAPAARIVPPPAPRTAASDNAAAALTRHLQIAGLGRSLTVSGAPGGAGAGGALLVAGILPATAAPAWQGVRSWFDATYGSRVALLERFDAPPGAAGGPPPLSVAAVALAPVPLVITRDGARYTQGAILPGGWEVQSITASAVTLRHDGQVLRITL